MKKKSLLKEVHKLQKIAGIIKENNMNAMNEAFVYDTPNLDVGEIGVYESELNDMFLNKGYLDTFPNAERLEDVEEELGKKLPKIFTFVIQGNFSDYDSVYDVGDGSIVYEEGYDGAIGIYKKEVLIKVIEELKQMGAKPYVQ